MRSRYLTVAAVAAVMLALLASGSAGAAVRDAAPRHTHTLSPSALPGTVTIHASAGTILAGKPVTVTAHLTTADPNTTVSIYRRPAGGSETLLTTGATNGGDLVITVRPSITTTYRAEWAGDTTVSANLTVNVRLVVHAATKGGYTTKSGVRLYHYTKKCSAAAHTGCPTFVASSSPLLQGKAVSFVVQAHQGGTWRRVTGGSFVTDATGKRTLIIYYTSRGVVGIKQRIQFSMAKDSGHLGNTSPWVQFRVTS